MHQIGNGNGETTDDEPPSAWEHDLAGIARIADPETRDALVAIVERDKLQWRQRVKYLGEVRGMKTNMENRDARIFAELGTLLALMQGTAARVARLDNEREVTRQQVKDVHRWAEDLKADADASQQRALVNAQQAAESIGKVATANIAAAVAGAQLEVERDARRSLTTETVMIRTETRARSWSLREKILAGVALSLMGGGGVVARWLWTKITEK